jgi:hypothetical protein
MATMPLPHESAPPTAPSQREVRIYSHSALCYWWPVWACGFLMAILTIFDGSLMALFPRGTEPYRNATVTAKVKDGVESTFIGRDVLVLPKDTHLQPFDKNEVLPPEPVYIHMSRHKDLGVLFAIVLLLIIVISNVPLHGLWSVIVILGVVLVSVVFALWGIWGTILNYFSLLQIHINAAGYLTISGVLFIIWALTVFVFDRRRYVVVTPGQVRVCMAVGAGETAYDSAGMTFTKRQDDLFRHWIVGLGSGDLIIHRTTATQEIDMPNVLFVGSKIREIEKLIKEQVVV